MSCQTILHLLLIKHLSSDNADRYIKPLSFSNPQEIQQLSLFRQWVLTHGHHSSMQPPVNFLCGHKLHSRLISFRLKHSSNHETIFCVSSVHSPFLCQSFALACVFSRAANTLIECTAFIFKDQEVLGEFFQHSLTPEDEGSTFL